MEKNKDGNAASHLGNIFRFVKLQAEPGTDRDRDRHGDSNLAQDRRVRARSTRGAGCGQGMTECTGARRYSQPRRLKKMPVRRAATTIASITSQKSNGSS